MTCQQGRVPPADDVQLEGGDQMVTESVSPESIACNFQSGLSDVYLGSASFGKSVEEVPDDGVEPMVVP